MRNGAQYLGSLADDRTIYVDGERVADVREHPAGLVDEFMATYELERGGPD